MVKNPSSFIFASCFEMTEVSRAGAWSDHGSDERSLKQKRLNSKAMSENATGSPHSLIASSF